MYHNVNDIVTLKWYNRAWRTASSINWQTTRITRKRLNRTQQFIELLLSQDIGLWQCVLSIEVGCVRVSCLSHWECSLNVS